MASRHVKYFPNRAQQTILSSNIRQHFRQRLPQQQQQQQTRSWSLLPDSQERRLNRLMHEANIHSHDPSVQAAYLRALGRVRPAEVIRRVELGKYATSEPVAKEYVRALVATGAIDNTQVSQILRTVGIATAMNSTHLSSQQTPSTQNATGAVTGAAAAASSSGSSSGTGAGGTGGGAGGSSSSSAGNSGGGFSNWGFNFRNATVNRLQQQMSTNASNTNAAAKIQPQQTEPIQVALAEPSTQSQLWRLVRVLGSTFLVLGFLGIIMEERGMMKGMGGINKEMKPEPELNNTTTFDDVKGCDEAKEELQEIVEFLRTPEKFTRLGGKLPKGVLLLGEPGTGKTLLAKAIAGEAKRPFFYASGSEFEEIFVGVGASRIRELFATAKKHSPCIIFIDEIDAVGGKRSPKDQRFLTMTLNQFLVELDGFNSKSGIIVIGATNFPESLDKALVRPGRFDRHVVVPVPDMNGRKEILSVHSENIPLHEDVDLQVIAQGTPGFTGADLANLINIACIKATIDNFKNVGMVHLEYAKDKILMGDERKSVLLSEDTRKITAYHEGGHALCCIHTKDALPVHKATIVPRGSALGLVAQLPDKDMVSMTKSQMKAKLIVCMGGRAAEELIYGNDQVTSGASSDFKQATQIAEAMVTQYGMCENSMGRVVYEKEKESSETRSKIEKEVRKLLDEAFEEAKSIIYRNQDELHRLAKALLKHETLTGNEVKLAMKGQLKENVENDKLSNGDRARGGEKEEEQGRKNVGHVLDNSDTAAMG